MMPEATGIDRPRIAPKRAIDEDHRQLAPSPGRPMLKPIRSDDLSGLVGQRPVKNPGGRIDESGEPDVDGPAAPLGIVEHRMPDRAGRLAAGPARVPRARASRHLRSSQ